MEDSLHNVDQNENEKEELAFASAEDSLHNVVENENENEELAFARVEDSLDSADEIENENEELAFARVEVSVRPCLPVTVNGNPIAKCGRETLKPACGFMKQETRMQVLESMNKVGSL
ncbi:hypothetical protein SESBI_50392 [Sesbania bispinosa]|nr:hypothetical protein SESBI_50392 [Sesbania bispinosa]